MVKASGKAAKGTIAEEGNQRIAAIYHIDNMYKGKPAEERLKHRHDSVEPLVDAYFAWVKTLAARPDIDKSTETGKAITYSLNQEKFLREFLTDAMIPLDNNDAERSVKNFCVAKHSWNVIGTKNGAKASVMLYSIAETAKANNLKTLITSNICLSKFFFIWMMILKNTSKSLCHGQIIFQRTVTRKNR